MATLNENLPFDASKAKLAMQELMKTPEGRVIAEKIKTKLRELDLQFDGLTDMDKKEFMKKFKGKFEETLDDLRDSIKKNVLDDSSDENFSSEPDFLNDQINSLQNSYEPNIWLFVAIFVILIVFG
jgi:hypothetical protein